MKTESVVASNWDDVVFENRNRDYGAYFIRKSYEKSMITGLGVSVCIASLLIILPQVFAMFNPPGVPKTPDVAMDGGIVIKPPPPIQKIKPVVPPPPQQHVETTRVLPPAVVDKDVDTTIPTKTDIDAAANTDSNNGTPGGTGTVVTDVVIPVEPTVIADPIFTTSQIQPSYADGMQGMVRFLSRNLKYPSSARRIGVQGAVYVTFVVGKDGKVRDIQVLRGISADCDKEAVRVISMMSGWKPGMQNDKPVSVRMTLPIRFQIQE